MLDAIALALFSEPVKPQTPQLQGSRFEYAISEGFGDGGYDWYLEKARTKCAALIKVDGQPITTLKIGEEVYFDVRGKHVIEITKDSGMCGNFGASREINFATDTRLTVAITRK